MRIKEILREYKRDLTANNFGEKLYAKAVNLELVNSWDRRLGLKLRNPDDKENAITRILELLEIADPTPNKQYVSWLARTYINSTTLHLEDILSSLADDLLKFHDLKVANKLAPEHADIGRFTKVQDFVAMIDKYETHEPELKDKGDSTELYNDNTVRAIIPNNQAAACYYGQGTKWCTSARKNNMFDSYNEQAPLLILFPKQPNYPGEKYQLQFTITDEAGNPVSGDEELGRLERDEAVIHGGQYMNEQDQEVSLSRIRRHLGASFDYVIDHYLDLFPQEAWTVKTALNYYS